MFGQLSAHLHEALVRSYVGSARVDPGRRRGAMASTATVPNTFLGGVGNDSRRSDRGANQLDGGLGRDSLSGLPGDDAIDKGPATDNADGGDHVAVDTRVYVEMVRDCELLRLRAVRGR